MSRETTAHDATPDATVTASDRTASLIVAGLAAACVASVAVFMTYGIEGDLAFALELRTRRVGALVVVGGALGYATVLFHTITHNRILTPNLLGVDALYVLTQMIAAVSIGTTAYVGIDVRLRFALEVTGMLTMTFALQRLVVRPHQRDLHLLILVSIVVGTMLGSLTSLVGRVIDPNEFMTVQDRLYASFSAVDRDLLVVTALVLAGTIAVSARWHHALDVVALGPDLATNLGVDHRRANGRVTVVCALLVATATALVGPITFLGLLASHVAYRLVRSHRHIVTLPAAALVGVLSLVAGQFVLEHVLDSTTRLSIIIGFVGGLVAIVLLVKERPA